MSRMVFAIVLVAVGVVSVVKIVSVKSSGSASASVRAANIDTGAIERALPQGLAEERYVTQ